MKDHDALVTMLREGAYSAKEISEATGYSHTYVRRCQRTSKVPGYCKESVIQRRDRIIEMSQTMTRSEIARELGMTWKAVRAVLRRAERAELMQPSITMRYHERKFVPVEPFRTWLERFILEEGGIEHAALWFGISSRTLRRILREQRYVTAAVVDQCVTAAGLPHLTEEWYGSLDG